MKNKLYDGSRKIIYSSPDEISLIMSFTDDIILDNGEKVNVAGKGVINNTLSAFLMGKLEVIGIQTHFVEKLNMREQLIEAVEVLPIQVNITALACGRYVSQFGIEEGYVFDCPIIDFKVKNRDFKYPAINEHQINSFGWLSNKEIKNVKEQAVRIYDFLAGIFAGNNIRLVDCELEFGRLYNSEDSEVIVVDEISLDNCRLWDMNTNEKFGYESINKINNPIDSYNLVMDRLNLQF